MQSKLERARMVAAKITGQFSDTSTPGKRSAEPDFDTANKKFASVNDAVGAQLAMLKAQQLGGNICEEYPVPDKLVGLVIGRGGEQLHRLQADTQCKVQIAPDSNGSPDRKFTLVGSKESIERAKRSIDEILKRGSSLGSDPSNPGASVVLQRSNCEIVEVKVPGNKCGLIIGKGGETIKRLSEQYGVKLVVVQDSSSASSGDKPLRITGEPEKVAAAKTAILEMLNPTDNFHARKDFGDRRQYGGPGQSETFIKVPGDKAGIVIGKGGESIKDINRRSGAHVEIDKSQRGASDGTDKMFIIKGSQEQIQYAQQLIYEKITGIQGSQPPHGYFSDPNAQMSPGHSAYGQRTGTPGYGQQQQQYMAYQGQQGVQQGQVDQQAAWAAYYQQYYGAAGQTAAAGAAQTGAAATTATAQPTVNPATGQPDYSQAWVEYYRSLGMHEQAEAILKQSSQGTGATQQTNGTPAASTATGAAATPTQQPQQTYSGSESKQNGNAYGGSSQGHTNGNYAQGQQSGSYGGAYGTQSGSYNGNGYSREAARH